MSLVANKVVFINRFLCRLGSMFWGVSPRGKILKHRNIVPDFSFNRAIYAIFLCFIFGKHRFLEIGDLGLG